MLLYWCKTVVICFLCFNILQSIFLCYLLYESLTSINAFHLSNNCTIQCKFISKSVDIPSLLKLLFDTVEFWYLEHGCLKYWEYFEVNWKFLPIFIKVHVFYPQYPEALGINSWIFLSPFKFKITKFDWLKARVLFLL